MVEPSPASRRSVDPLNVLRERLRRLHRTSGEPSTREISRRTAKAISHTTVSAVLHCRTSPRWGQLELVVEALGGDTDEFRDLWVAARDAEDLATGAADDTAAPRQPAAIEPRAKADGFGHFTDSAAPVETGSGPPVRWPSHVAVLAVEDEVSQLSYVDGEYRCTVERVIYNASAEPITRYPIRISVDRFPDNPVQSTRFYREHPLTWEELRLRADCAGEPMSFRPTRDHDSSKEVLLLFENAQSRFPLYPGQRTTIAYSYRVGDDKWGNWYHRQIRMPTRRLTIRLEFPAGLDPVVWGVQSSLTAEATDLRTPVERTELGDRVRFTWSTDHPVMHTGYRLEWRFRPPLPARNAADTSVSAAVQASERMAAAGILQRGDDRLRQAARPFDLPADESRAREVAGALRAALDRVFGPRLFGEGVGLAAPQLGLDWAVAVVRPPGQEGNDDESVVLVNPRVITRSSDDDEQYEGCLSFADVRGAVRRPRRLHVEHDSMKGARISASFEGQMARLVEHEIDHLAGRLYVDRMAAGSRLVPVEEYRSSGRPWRY
jgi:peptide deformylase